MDVWDAYREYEKWCEEHGLPPLEFLYWAEDWEESKDEN